MPLPPPRRALRAAALLLRLLAACDPPLPQPTTGSGPKARWSHGYAALAFATAMMGAGPRLVTEADGTTTVAGTVFTPVQLGPAALTPHPAGSTYVVRYDAAGRPLWARLVGRTDRAVHAAGLARDAAGGLWVLANEAPQAGATGATGMRPLLLHLGADGSGPGEHPLLVSGAAAVAGELGPGPGGGVTVTLRAFGDVDVGTGVLRASEDPYADVVLADVDATGRVVRASRHGGPGYDDVHAVAGNAAGLQALAGTFNTSLDLGTGPLGTPPPPSVLTGTGFLALRGADGRVLWAQGLPAQAVPTAAALDAAGQVHVLLIVDGGADLGWGPLRNTGVLLKLAPDGTRLWAKELGKARPYALAVGEDGRALVTGHFVAGLELGGEPLVSAGQDDAFVATFDAQGQHLGSRGFGSARGMEWGRAAGLDAAGHAYVAGLFSGPTDLGAGPVTTGVGPSPFVASFPR